MFFVFSMGDNGGNDDPPTRRQHLGITAAAVAAACCAFLLSALAPRTALSLAVQQHAALRAGRPTFDGAPIVQYAPLTQLLDDPAPQLRPSDSWEPRRGWAPALDAAEQGSRGLAERLVHNELPYVWRKDPVSSQAPALFIAVSGSILTACFVFCRGSCGWPRPGQAGWT